MLVRIAKVDGEWAVGRHVTLIITTGLHHPEEILERIVTDGKREGIDL